VGHLKTHQYNAYNAMHGFAYNAIHGSE
jgi:hypothetical protein